MMFEIQLNSANYFETCSFHIYIYSMIFIIDSIILFYAIYLNNDILLPNVTISELNHK